MGENNYTIIRPNRSLISAFSELFNYKDLIFSLVSRDIKIIYKQSVLGVGWALIRPIISMIIFTIIFGKVAKLNTDGLPEPLFYLSGLVPWLYFSTAVTSSSLSLRANSNILTRVYFPRLILPFTPVISKLMDFAIALVLLFLMIIYYGLIPSVNLIFLPLIVLLLILTATGFGLWLSALSVQYRDISHASGYLIQILLFVSPVIISVSDIPDKYLNLYSFYPLVGIIEGLRASLIGTNTIPWDLILPGVLTTLVILVSGVFVFNKTEKHLADII